MTVDYRELNKVTPPIHAASPGNDEADTLARVRWVENSPSENIAYWLHQKLRHAGQKTMWAAAKAWGLPKQAPKQEECGRKDNNRAEKQDKDKWGPSFLKYSSYEAESQAELTTKSRLRPIEKLDYERTRGGGRGGMRGRGRGGRINRSFDGFNQRGKWEFERKSDSDKIGMELTAPMEATAETARSPRMSEGESQQV
ncbi:intracellular hyaluronan-binding protein 4 [Cyrtonyx montezumae]|uniref:intracellular hyaluronan-binding protein 4 n=1 Tax=Cyrtonyx montezumae TaxID=9017 RepID=UPI0032DBA592